LTIVNGYGDLVGYKTRFFGDTSDTSDDNILEPIIEATSRLIDNITGRRFYAADETRYYTPTDAECLFVDDLLTISTLKTDGDGDRTYETTWDTGDYDLMPLNSSADGAPYTWIEPAVQGSYVFPIMKASVELTGKFGYSPSYESVVNSGMEGVYEDESGVGAGTINVAPGWNNSGCEVDGTDELSRDTTVVHSGSASQKIAVSAANEGITTDTDVFASGRWYTVVVWLYASLGKVRILDSDNEFLDEIVSPTSAWAQYSFRVKATSAQALIICSSAGAATFYVDDVSVTSLPAPITEALYLGAHRARKRLDTPLGVSGSPRTGQIIKEVESLRLDEDFMAWIDPYIRKV